jgi:peroxiredoxin
MKLLFILLLLTQVQDRTFGQDEHKVDKGDKAYNFIGIDQNGSEVSIDSYRGKYILLNFTATFCGPCWSTYNQMNKLQEEYLNELKVISFHWDDEKVEWQRIADKHQIKFNCTSVWEAEKKTEISEIYQVDGFPYFFMIDRNGRIVKKWFGNRNEKLERIVRRYCKH